MITLHELLEDPVYKKYFLSPPHLTDTARVAPPWRVYIQREADGRWAKKELETYTDAFKFLKPFLKTCHDAAIQSKGVAFRPPTRWVKITKNGEPVMITAADGSVRQKTKEIPWLPKLPEGEGVHHWCTYCRRPTIFGWFSSHHAFPRGMVFDPALQRCTICGSSERLVMWYAK